MKLASHSTLCTHVVPHARSGGLFGNSKQRKKETAEQYARKDAKRDQLNDEFGKSKMENHAVQTQRSGKFLDEDTVGLLAIGGIGLGVVLTAGAVFFSGVYKLIDKGIDVLRERKSSSPHNVPESQKLPIYTLATPPVSNFYSGSAGSSLPPVYYNSSTAIQGFRPNRNLGSSSLVLSI